MKLKEGFDINVINSYNEFVENKLKHVAEKLDINYDLFAPKDSKGIKHLLGVFDLDGKYKEFKTQGAKKYAYIKEYKKEKIKDKTKVNVVKENKDTYDILEITVSGVPKNGAFDLKTLDDFKDDLEFTFKNTNKNTIYYSENQKEIELTDYLGNKTKVNDKSGCCLLPTTYKLSKALEYSYLLDSECTERALYNE